MKDMKPFIIDLAIGVVLIVIGLVVQVDYYSTMIFAAGCGMACASAVHLGRLVYWQNPKREIEYAAKKQEAHINRVDERKQYLRMKAGQVTYQIMTFALLALSFILALLRVEPWVIGMVFLLFVGQWLLGVLVYSRLEKSM